jgi:4-hydroxybenzoate polyprenyltransferase
VDAIEPERATGRAHRESSTAGPAPARRMVMGAWKLHVNDYWAGIVPGVAFSAAAAHYRNLPLPDLGVVLAKSVVYFTLYLGVHVIVNQLMGVEEDKIDKPWRPLPSGLLSLRHARAFRDVLLICFPLLGWLWGVGVWALLWQTLVMMQVQTRLTERFGIAKNMYCGIGAVAQLAAAWRLAGPLVSKAWLWIAVVAAFVTVTAHTQDVRDVAGDRSAGRRTLPVVMGDRATRVSLVGAFLAVVAMQYLLVRPHTLPSWGAWFVPSALLATSGVLLTRNRGATTDHRAYRYYEQWYAAVCAAAMVVVH